ncbi:terpenoid synthase [Ganoderma leucocontextum]|nr:terpenoid synthase [Ganoderma leucocontextum]
MTSRSESPNANRPLGYLRLPDMLEDWPWQRKINPLYEEVAAEGDAWLRSFLPFNPQSQYAFERCQFGLCAALLVPEAPRDQLRTCVDLLNIFFLIDEYTDVEPASRVGEIIEACNDALHHPSRPRPDGEVILGEVIRQFWERGQRTATSSGGKHFVASFTDYLNSVVKEGEARDRGVILTRDAYLAICLENVGVRSLYAMGELLLSIPDHLYEHPLLARMTRLGCEIITINNDVVSYNREQATGVGGFNIVTITMHHDGLTLDDAIRSLVKRNLELEGQYVQCLREFCSFLGGPGRAEKTSDSEIRRYLEHMGNVRRGVWCWSFECGRYFGERGSVYAKTQLVPLIAKRIGDRYRRLRGNQVDILLMETELAKL